MATNTTVKSKGGTEYGYFRITKTIGYKYVEGRKTPIRKTFYGSSKKMLKKNMNYGKRMKIRIKNRLKL